ncbi:bifunctional ornithine acetyltransferase/N-acetylglutamate synthase [Methanococcoides orientis]|uniref:bifunctional ornithine acetyltransferase/N-acetylglutamate synthase n=1 Tax=Methanococcoides orientis TaxID=2822137 RepID=UPI001E5FE007|nr:bifunctional ornithine acetyltransferase/N-acetylglutamate synthase [Methanococcoides orientis]UGV40066.1 bifunctional ornithine acetyltransferase/N-acetylglutamate synthase [Methanococcoides orientis]
MKIIDGGICSVKGVRSYGIKPGKMGLAVIVGEGNAAGVFTRNKVIAAPLVVTREALQKNGKLVAIIANSGNANAFTGEEGLADAREMASVLSTKLGVDSELVGVASTGVIGRKLDVGWIKDNIDEVVGSLTSSPQGNSQAARAIMTTDTVPKMAAVELNSGICIGGIGKGSGMIEPNMGTMLGFVYTDAEVATDVLDSCLKKAVDKSFNMVVVDGDTSTNDMVLLTATGASGIKPDMDEFQHGLEHVLTDLAKQIAKDGEGATRLIEAQVKGAVSEADARLVAKAIVRSPLVKSAIFGKDPNWGRVVAAAGYSGAEMDQGKISLAFSNGPDSAVLVDNGKIVSEDNELLEKLGSIMGSPEVIIKVGLHMADYCATAWGCDLTYDYVKINAEYTT